MTRETKIGLLVGLAFIIVIGILLSDHLTSSTEPPPAILAQTGQNVRETVGTPGGVQAPIAPVITPPQIQPQHPVPTPRELQPQTPATAIVQVGGPSAQAQQLQTAAVEPPITIAQNLQTQAMQQQAQPQYSQEVAGADSPNGNLNQLAQHHGEPLVTITPAGFQQSATTAGPTHTNRDVAEYTAQAGDSLSRMALNVMGANTKANREAIVRANPSLQQNPNMVFAGRVYRIPASASVAAAAPVQAVVAAGPAAAQAPAGLTEYWYTVKEGDSLWRIASEQLGQDGAAVSAIKELNKDTLKGGDVIHPNMRLRLPGKPMAQAN